MLKIKGGSLIGLERTRRGRHAGLREHALVCLGACQLMLLGVYAWTEGVTPVAFDGGSERIIQGLMTGVGFIGAGGIIKEGFSVRGITTASSLWVTTSIGVLVGLGFFFPAAVTTVLTLAALVMMRWWEERIRSKHELQNRRSRLCWPRMAATFLRSAPMALAKAVSSTIAPLSPPPTEPPITP